MIMSARPDSANLVDIHVYLLPQAYWISNQNLAYNESVAESVSVGFVRVGVELALSELREHIERQCQPGLVPSQYVFLRSVGRALTRVRPSQEFELKVKNFVPPRTLSPEVILLELDEHRQYENELTRATSRASMKKRHTLAISATSSLLTAASPYYYDNYQRRHSIKDRSIREVDDSEDDDDELESLPMIGEMGSHAIKYSSTSSRRSLMYDDAEKIREFERLREEQERLKRRQLDLQSLREKQMAELHKVKSLKSKKPLAESKVANFETIPEQLTNRTIEQDAEASEKEDEPDKSSPRARPSPVPSPKPITHRRSMVNLIKKDLSPPRQNEPKIVEPIQSHINTKSKKNQESVKSEKVPPEPIRRSASVHSSAKSDKLDSPRISEHHSSNSQRPASYKSETKSSPSDERVDSRSTHRESPTPVIRETRKRSAKKKEILEPPVIHVQEEETKSRPESLQAPIEKKKPIEKERQKGDPVEKKKPIEIERKETKPEKPPANKVVDEEVKLKEKSPVSDGTSEDKDYVDDDDSSIEYISTNRSLNSKQESSVSKDDDSIEKQNSNIASRSMTRIVAVNDEDKASPDVSFELNGSLRQETTSNKTNEPARSNRVNGGESNGHVKKDPPEVKQQQAIEPDEVDIYAPQCDKLREQLKSMREQRHQMERARDELIRNLKSLYNKLAIQKKDTKDVWRKKFYAEKKKTPELEERVDMLTKEINGNESKMYISLEAELKSMNVASSNRQEKEARKAWLKSMKMKEEIYLLERQLDQSKLKLITDIKLRTQADLESKQLRAELIHTKMTLNELRNELKASQ